MPTARHIMSPHSSPAPVGFWRHSAWDALPVALALTHGWFLSRQPAWWCVGLALWWNANSVSHLFIHAPFFRRPGLNRAFGFYLTLVLGFPQTVWRQRHLAHHAGRPWHGPVESWVFAETAALAGLWSVWWIWAPGFFLQHYVPGWCAGMALCWLQGYFEHWRGTVSHHGRLYNLLFFNDGFHVEHHWHPALHWRRLPAHRQEQAATSRWPAVLRWLEWASLDELERLVLRSPRLQELLLRWHEGAFRRLLRHHAPLRAAGIVGGGLFPRTALVLQRLYPGIRLRIVDCNPQHLHTARLRLGDTAEFLLASYGTPEAESFLQGVDALVFPLAFRGDRRAVSRQAPARHVLVHDWIWQHRGQGVAVSVFLLKRLNLIEP